jgi:hypothetical protein
MISSSLSRRSLANTSMVRQTITEKDRIDAPKKHSWVKTMMMTNPLTAPVVLIQELLAKK